MSDEFRLTIRELDVLRLMARGYMNKQIAADFRITEQATKNHVTRILKKMGAANRTQAVIKASRCGLILLEM